MFWGRIRSTTSCHSFGAHPASSNATVCRNCGQPPAFWYTTPCRKFGCHKVSKNATSCPLVSEILPEIWVSQGHKQGTLCHWGCAILPPMNATVCFGECAILPPSGNNTLSLQQWNTLLIRRWDTLPLSALPLDSLFFPLACPPWAGRIDLDPVRTGSGMFH
jgi:hypothetical protein